MSSHFEFGAAQEVLSVEPAVSRSKGLYNKFGKRILDVVLVLMSLPLVLPVVLVIALLVRRDGGPVFFGHTRVGTNGKLFKCWKVRSMVPNAEEKLQALLKSDPAVRAIWEKDFKLDDDPRVTKLGKFLRKSSLDELPQLFNVLMGEMSLIGPRPVTKKEIERYGASAKVILTLRPGVSGMWQVSGRNDLDYDSRIELDLYYAENLSLAKDIKIILMTLKSVLVGTGK